MWRNMLDYAQNHERQLKIKALWIADDQRNKLFFLGNDNINLFKDETKAHEFVSLDNENNIVGLIRYGIYNNYAHNLETIHFDGDDKIFARDLLTICKDVFELYDLDKLQFSANKNHPMLEKYKSLVKHYNGSCKENGNYFMFEITKEKYFGK